MVSKQRLLLMVVMDGLKLNKFKSENDRFLEHSTFSIICKEQISAGKKFIFS